MKITVICGTNKKEKSTTYNLARRVAESLARKEDIKYFFLPKDLSHFCCGCMQCFEGHHEKCPAYSDLKIIRDAMDSSQLIIFAAPVYVYHVSGQLKSFLDHFGREWMVHQLNGKMFKKQSLIISTAAGAGMKSTVKDIRDSLDFWGIGKVYTYKKAVAAVDWMGVSPVRKEKMIKDMAGIAKKIKNDSRKINPRIKVKVMFYAFRIMHKYMRLNSIDVEHWEKNGWLGKNRPWK